MLGLAWGKGYEVRKEWLCFSGRKKHTLQGGNQIVVYGAKDRIMEGIARVEISHRYWMPPPRTFAATC